MRYIGLALLALSAATLFALRPGKDGAESKLLSGNVRFAILPPLVMAVFAFGAAFVISG